MYNVLVLRAMLRSRFSSERGAGLAEYALILFLISIVAAAALGPLGTAISGVFNSATTDIGGTP